MSLPGVINTCGCQVDPREGLDDAGQPGVRYAIRYCALHGAAPELLATIGPFLEFARISVCQLTEMLEDPMARTLAERVGFRRLRQQWQDLIAAYQQAIQGAQPAPPLQDDGKGDPYVG